MKDTKQNANNNTNTTVIQVNGDYYSGITESQAKEIALATVRNEFSILYGEAQNIFEKRVQEIVDESLLRIQHDSPESFKRFNAPAIQLILNTVYKEYAKSGDSDLKQRLIDLLIARIKVSEHTFTQILIDDAIRITPKIRIQHLQFLTSLFFIYSGLVTFTCIAEYDECITMLAKNYPLYPKEASLFNVNDVYFLALLKHTGCITYAESSSSLVEEEILICFGGIFNKGFKISDIDSALKKELEEHNLICTSEIQPGNVRINTRNEFILRLDVNKISKKYRKNMYDLYVNNCSTVEDLRNYNKSLDNRVHAIFESVNFLNRTEHYSLSEFGLFLGQQNFYKMFPRYYTSFD